MTNSRRSTGGRPRRTTIVVATIFCLSTSSLLPASASSDMCVQPGRNSVISTAAAEAVIAANVHDIYRATSILVLSAIVENKLTNLGFELSDGDRRLAIEHLSLIEGTVKEESNTQPDDIHWPIAGVVILHPSKWLGLSEFRGGKAAEEACAGYRPRLECEVTDISASAQRGIARMLLDRASVCSDGSTDEPFRTEHLKTPVLQLWHALLVADDRFIRQHRHLADLRNKPFRQPGLESQMLYADFFNQALAQRNVAAYAPDYLASANPLSRFRLHEELRALIGLLLDNRLLN